MNDKLLEYYRIADLLLLLEVQAGWDSAILLPSFVPFKLDNAPKEEPAIAVSLELDKGMKPPTGARLLSDISYILDHRFRFEETETHYVTTALEKDTDRQWYMYSSKDFRTNTVYATSHDIYGSYKLAWLIMVAFGQCVLQENGLLLHASVVMKEGQAYGFMGKSGTGKSTHSRLWLKYIPQTSLLNDDNPVLRLDKEGKVWIYGSPWSGKTPCYKPIKAPLKALVRLQQAPVNELNNLEGMQAVMALLPGATAIRWNDGLYQRMVDHIVRLTEQVSIASLKCLPDEEAAKLCWGRFEG